MTGDQDVNYLSLLLTILLLAGIIFIPSFIDNIKRKMISNLELEVSRCDSGIYGDIKIERIKTFNPGMAEYAMLTVKEGNTVSVRRNVLVGFKCWLNPSDFSVFSYHNVLAQVKAIGIGVDKRNKLMDNPGGVISLADYRPKGRYND